MSAVETSSTATDILTQRARVPGHVVHRSFPAETVVLNLETGCYHGLNPVGGAFLSALERSPTVAAAASSLVEQHGWARSEIEGDLANFCADLAARGLLTLEHPAGG